MEKMICPSCNHVIVIDENKINADGKIICPKCDNEIKIDDARKRYEDHKKFLSNDAYKSMYIYKDYNAAKEAYNNYLKLEPKDLPSILGLLTCDIKLSTLDKPIFDNIIKTIDSIDIILNGENSFTLLSFMNDSIYSFDEYLSSSNSFMKDEIFLSKKYFDIFVKTIKTILSIATFYKDSLQIVDEEELEFFKNDNPYFISNLDKIISGIKNRLNKEYKINDVGIIKLNNGEEEIIESKKFSIQYNESELDLCIYKNEKKTKGLKNKITYTVLGLLFICLIFILLFIFTKLKIFIYLFFIPLGLLILFIVYIRKALNLK